MPHCTQNTFYLIHMCMFSLRHISSTCLKFNFWLSYKTPSIYPPAQEMASPSSQLLPSSSYIAATEAFLNISWTWLPSSPSPLKIGLGFWYLCDVCPDSVYHCIWPVLTVEVVSWPLNLISEVKFNVFYCIPVPISPGAWIQLPTTLLMIDCLVIN